MSKSARAIIADPPVYKASTKQLAEPFISEVEEVFNCLEELTPEAGTPTDPSGPSADTVAWAKEVLLRVLPRKFLLGAEISVFQREIHVTWENDERGKKVVVFFPEGQRQLKIYHESLRNNVVVEHRLVNTTGACDISARLQWFFQ